MDKEQLDLLEQLCLLHSTPGDESCVALALLRQWQTAGWQTGALGRYAVYARSPEWQENAPTVMLCAHADSPGFIVQSIDASGVGQLAVLGGPHVAGDVEPEVQLKGADGLYAGTLTATPVEGGKPTYAVRSADKALARGDRVCFKPQFGVSGDFVNATFLDNRLGCWALANTARALGGAHLPVNVILAATSSEEMTGFGANVLAANLHADMVVCLDATYTAPEQNVLFGKGPVLTISDKSTLLSPADCQTVAAVFAKWGMPLQTEVYDYSGTDARAFPSQGFPGPVLALLVATEGNHTQVEKAAVEDIRAYGEMCIRFCQDAGAFAVIGSVWNRWERLARVTRAE